MSVGFFPAAMSFRVATSDVSLHVPVDLCREPNSEGTTPGLPGARRQASCRTTTTTGGDDPKPRQHRRVGVGSWCRVAGLSACHLSLSLPMEQSQINSGRGEFVIEWELKRDG